ncbi:MAG: metallophosphoesterase [Chloroflexi bacterium]|nr:metallophosphoesterase [Chloroflexota bacterium]
MAEEHSIRPPAISRRGCLKAAGVAVSAVAALGGAAWYARALAPQRLEVTTHEIPVPDLPPELDGLRLAHLTDLHASAIVPPEWIRAAVDRLNELEPDVACLTGDFVYGSTVWADGCAEELARLKAPGGLFAVLGNHDHWTGAAAIAEALAQRGIRVLRDETLSLEVRRSQLQLLGVDDPGLSCLGDAALWDGLSREWAEAGEFVRQTLAEVPAGVPTLLLVHNPDFMELLSGLAVDVALAGHTHGGQVALPFAGPLLLPSCFGDKYAAGWAASPGGPVYVNRGVGLIEPALRWNCPPEAALITLRRGTAAAGTRRRTAAARGYNRGEGLSCDPYLAA